MHTAAKLSGSQIRWPWTVSLCASAFIACHPAMAQTAPELQTLSCSSPPRLSNTGVDALGNKLGIGMADPYWELANAAPTNNIYDPSYSYPWQPAIVTRELQWPDFIWQTPPEGAWIAWDADYSGWPTMFHRYRFNLSADTPPDRFAIHGRFFADDRINAVYINGIRQSSDTFTDSGWTPDAPHMSTPGYFSLRSDWRTGMNEVVVAVRNNTNVTYPDPRFPQGLAMESASFCGSAAISKTFSRQSLHPGETADMRIEIRSLLPPLAGELPVTDVEFTDTLPAPLQVAGPVKSSTCNGRVSAVPGSDKVTLENGALLPASTTDAAWCEVIVPVVWPVSAAAECPKTVTNTIDPENGAFNTSVGHNPAIASADISCESRTGEIAIHKIMALPPGINGPLHFRFVADCDKPVAGSRFSGSLSFPQAHWTTIDGIPAGAHCSIHEELPDAPPNWSWQSPVITPAGITMPDDPKAPVPVEVRNALAMSAPIPQNQKAVPVDSKLVLALLVAAVAVAGMTGMARRKSS